MLSLRRAGVRKRPSLFRALGRKEPPALISIRDHSYDLVEVLKHDSWAATAIYQGPAGKIVCKFNRIEPILGVPMGWLGCRLAAREGRALKRLDGLRGIPPFRGPIKCGCARLENAVAHDYIEGRPLAKDDGVPGEFLLSLQELLAAVHRRGMAYVDLHKRENILVGDDGRPYLIDFQIHYGLNNTLWGHTPLARYLLRLLQLSDDYHLRKHLVHYSGDQLTPAERLEMLTPPPWIRWHRKIAQPLRSMRRRLLVALNVRNSNGRAESEFAPEDAVRRALASQEKVAA